MADEVKRQVMDPGEWGDESIVARVEGWLWDRAFDTQGMIEREEEALERWLAQRRKPDDDLPWEGASNFDMGGYASQGHVESIHAQTMKILRSSWPWFRFDGDSKEACRQGESYLRHKFERVVPLMGFVDRWTHDALIGGMRYARVRWAREHQRHGDVFFVNPRTLDPGARPPWEMSESEIKQLLSVVVATRFAEVVRLSWGKEGIFRFAARIGGDVVAVSAEYEEADLRFKVTCRYEKLVRNDASYELVLPEDLWKAPGPINSCPYVIHRVWLPWSEVVRRVTSGQYKGIDLDADWVYATDPVTQVEGGAQLVETRRDVAGEAPIIPQHDRYEFLECFVLDRFGKKVLEDRMITLFRSKKIVVRNVLASEEGYDERPFSFIAIQPVPGKYDYALGIPTLIASAADEMTAVHNLMIDIATIRGIPWFAYDATAQTAENEMRFRPGAGTPINPPDGDISKALFFPTLNGQIGELMNLEMEIDQAAKTIDGVSAMQLMKSPRARTAAQSSMEAGIANIRFEVFLDRIIGSVAERSGITWLLELTARLYHKFGTPVEAVAFSGVSAPLSFPEMPYFALKIDADVIALDGQRRLQRAQTVLQTILNPALLQMKIANPEKVHNAVYDILHSMGVSDPSRYLADPPKDVQPMAPEQENALMMQGEMRDVLPVDNDAEHLPAHRAFVADIQAMSENFPPETYNVIYQVFSQHIRQHVRQENAKKQAQTSAVQGLNLANPEATPSFGRMGFLPGSGAPAPSPNGGPPTPAAPMPQMGGGGAPMEGG